MTLAELAERYSYARATDIEDRIAWCMAEQDYDHLDDLLLIDDGLGNGAAPASRWAR
jgi:hypothetical protein